MACTTEKSEKKEMHIIPSLLPQPMSPGAMITQGFVEDIDSGKIHRSRRPLRSELHDIDELSSSVIEKGLLCPIVVRPRDNGRFFEVVAGNRRFEACKRLKIKRIPCYVAEFDDREAYEASLVENLQRKTLDPLEEAKAFERYVDEYGYGSASELSRRIGKSPSYVSRRIALLKLPKKVQEQLLLRGAKLGMAQELLSLGSDDEHTEALTELIIEKKVKTGSEVRRIIRHSMSSHSIGEKENRNLLAEQRQQQEEDDSTYYYSTRDVRQHALDRAFNKYIASLKVCMMRLDEVLDSIDENEEWVVRETLMQYRGYVHKHIDSLIRLKMRTQLLGELPASTKSS
ncbi:MAG: ParB/RepB/Spo0J family partition protein [Nitrososphaerales archaeon]